MRKIVFTAAVLALLAFGAPLVAQDEESRRYAEIQGLIADELHDQALARIDEFLRDFPTSLTAEVLTLQRAELLFKTDRYVDAASVLELFMRQYPASQRAEQARFLLASAYRLTGRLSEAITELTNLLRERRLDDELRVAALERRAEISLQLGRPEDALGDLEELVKRAGTAARNYRLANVYYELGRFRQAESLYRRLVNESSFTVEEQRTIILRLALVLYQRDRYRDIVNLLRPLQERYREDDAVMMTLAWALYRMQRFEEAWQVVSGRPVKEGSVLAASIREGRSLVMVHEYGAAVQFLERLIENATPARGLEPAYRALSQAYFALGDDVSGIEALEQLAPVLEDDEKRFGLWVEVGDLYESRLQDRSGAVAAYRKALAINPRGVESEEVAVKVIRAQVEMGEVAEASDAIIRMIQDFPDSRFMDELLFLSGQLYERISDHTKALEQYRNVAQRRGSSPFRQLAYEAGLALVSKLRRWEEVIAVGREYLQEFPEAGQNAWLHLTIAQAYYQNEQYTEGIRHFEQALTAESGEVRVSRALLDIGWGCYKLGDFERAASYYSRVADQHAGEPELEEALYWLGWLAQVESDLSRANHFFGRMLQQFPRSRYAEISLWQVANNHIRRGENNEAVSALNSIIDGFPDGMYADLARRKLVEAYVGVGNYRAALEKMDIFVEGDPSLQTNPADMLARGDSLAQAGNRRAALETFLKLLEQFPASDVVDDATLNIGILQYQQGNYSEAVTVLRRVRENFPESEKVAAAAYYLGQSLMRLRRYEDAVTQFQTALEKGGQGEGAEIVHYLIGVCFEQLGRQDSAVGAYRNYLALLSDPAEELERRYQISLLFARRGNLEEAAEQLAGIIEAAEDPDLIVRTQFALGAVHEKNNQLELAAVEYLKVTYVHSSSPLAALSARFKAGQLFEQLGQHREAINVYQKIAQNHAGTRFGEVASIRIQALQKIMESNSGETPEEEPQ